MNNKDISQQKNNSFSTNLSTQCDFKECHYVNCHCIKHVNMQQIKNFRIVFI